MKHKLIVSNALIAVFLFFSFTYCKSADKYTFEFKLEKGKTYKQQAATTGNISINMMGQDIKTSMTMDMRTNYAIIGHQNDLYDMQMTYKKMKLSIEGGPARFVVDTDLPDASSSMNLGGVLKSIIDIPVDIQMTKKGKVNAVKGIDKIKNAVSEKLDANASPTAKQQFAAIFDQQFSEEAIKTTFSQISAYFPEKPVAIGDSWEVNIPFNTGGVTILCQMKLTLKRVANNIATLDCAGTIETPAEGAVQKMQGVEAKVTIKGKQTGTVQIDMKTGWTIGAEITQQFDQEIEAMGQKIPQKVEMKTILSAD
jgi:hypothetical protein